jgi:hypothetical protein
VQIAVHRGVNSYAYGTLAYQTPDTRLLKSVSPRRETNNCEAINIHLLQYNYNIVWELNQGCNMTFLYKAGGVIGVFQRVPEKRG